MSQTVASLVDTPVSSLQTLPPSSTMQSVTSNVGTLAPLSVDATVLNSGTPGTIVSLPQTFCFPSNQIGNNNLPTSITVTNTSNNASSQLSTISLGSVFSGVPTHFVQPMAVPPHQALALPLSQNQQHMQTNQQALSSVPHALTLSQVPQSIGIVSQPLPVGQGVCSSMASPSLNFVNPTLITMSGPTGQQNQYLSNPFTQFPIMLNNQQNILTSVNPATPLTSQPIESSTVSHISGVVPLPHSQISMTNNLMSTSNNPVSLNLISGNPASLSSQPVSVFSFVSPAMSVATDTSSHPSPDTTHSIQPSHVDQISRAEEGSSLVSSSTPPTAIIPITLSSSPEAVKSESPVISKTEHLPSGKKVFNLEPSLSRPSVGRARMKFTPIDPDYIGSSVTEKQLNSPPDQDSNVGLGDKHEGDENSFAGMAEIDYQNPCKNHSGRSHVVDIKQEPYDCDGDEPDDDSLKHSPSPVEGMDLPRKNDHMGEVNSKFDTQGDLADVEDLEETEFVWEDYLRETGATAVPPTAFKHVEISLQSGFSKGMKLEAPNKHNPNTFWVATIVMTCGPLLRLRYEGYNDNSSADFWSDPMTSDIHPLGWCEENGKTLQPPEALKEKYPDWQSFLNKCLQDVVTAPSYLLDKSTGATPVDQMKEGMRLEIQDSMRPDQVWLVKIMENIGGRLFLRYEGFETASNDFWLFYLDERLHPIGWCKSAGCQYKPPSVLKYESSKSEDQLLELLETALMDASSQNLPADIFDPVLPPREVLVLYLSVDQREIEPHKFEVGMKLEAVDPSNGNNICPATVVEVINPKYFIVEIDSLIGSSTEKKTRFCCDRNTPTIFPIDWAVSKGIKLAPPQGWSGTEFKWSEYLESSHASAAPEDLFNLDVPEHEFECGMKLEAVKPSQPSQICAATITKIVEHLMWIHLDSSKRMMDSHVESIHSLNLFPIGWCVSNGYQLKPPGRLSGVASSQRRVAVVQPEIADNQKAESQVHSSTGRELFGGPQIYFNHRCFSGPYLSKGRIAELPRSMGPGPVTLVMKEVLSKLINTAYKSCRVLRELQLEGKPNPNMTQQMLKAKYKGKSYRAIVEICRTASQLEEFCRQVCIKLECCPNLISPHFVNGSCPENCAQLTKTKYTYYYGKRKKKIGRPPGGHSNLENGQKKPGKRRKRKKIGMMAKRSSRATVEDQGDNVDDDKVSVCSDTKTVDSTSTSGSKDALEYKPPKSRTNQSTGVKRRYTHHIPPPSEIQTRGAKLPKYSFEKRTHKKIMIVEGSQQNMRSKKEVLKTSHVMRESQAESSFSATRPDMPVCLKSEPPLKLKKNPLDWTVSEVGEFLQTTDCADKDLVARLRTEEIDGQALLLLTLPNVQEYMGIKLGPAIKLCHLIERIKIAFYESFAK